MSESGSAAVVTGQLIATDVITKAGQNPNTVFQTGLRDWGALAVGRGADLPQTRPFRTSYVALDGRLTSIGDTLVKRLLRENPAGF